MIRVIFPNGLVLEYERANYFYRREYYTDAYTEKGGEWVFQIPHASGAMLESERATAEGIIPVTDRCRSIRRHARTRKPRRQHQVQF